MHTLYKRTMTFFKSVTNDKGMPMAEPHKDPDISSFKTTRYPYAFPFKDEEDNHALPLAGILAGFGETEEKNYEIAFFDASDWYAETNTKILSCFRNLLAAISYDDDIVGRDTEKEQARKTISQRLWERLNDRQNGNASIIDELHATVGIRILSVELRSIDPPEGWRDTTLAPYKAEREKEAAKHQAEASAILFDDTNQALKVWLEGQRAAGYKPTQAQIEAKQEELRQRALAKTPGYQQVHIKGLEGATTAVVGSGGGAGILIGGQGGGKGNPAGGKGKKGGKKKGFEDMTPEELRRAYKRLKAGKDPLSNDDDEEEEEDTK